MNKKTIAIVALIASVIGITGYIAFRNRSAVSQADQLITYEASADWQLIDAHYFSLFLPTDWEQQALQGIDSYVGEFIGDDVRLRYDFGWYSNSLAEDGDSRHVVTYEMINGHQAKLVVPAVVGDGMTGVYFEKLGSNQMDRFSIFGSDLTADQQEIALTIFRSIEILK